MSWTKEIQVGDVLRNKKSGMLRVVRKVTGTAHGFVHVVFAIKRCSRTGRCYTVYNEHDLKLLFEPTGVRYNHRRTALDRQINVAIYGDYDKTYLGCCAVKGAR